MTIPLPPYIYVDQFYMYKYISFLKMKIKLFKGSLLIHKTYLTNDMHLMSK